MAGGMFSARPQTLAGLLGITSPQPPQNVLGGLGALVAQHPNALAPMGMFAQAATPPQPSYSSLLSDAEKRYPFIKQYNPVVTFSPNRGGGDYAETWHPNDPGDNSRKRPSTIPLNRVGVEVYRPDQFGATDLAAEFLHVDPYANATRKSLLQSFSPQQIEQLKRESGDYADSLKYGSTPQKALENAVDSAMRGYTVGQWPDDANARMGYTPQQLQMLNALRSYMQTGRR